MLHISRPALLRYFFKDSVDQSQYKIYTLFASSILWTNIPTLLWAHCCRVLTNTYRVLLLLPLYQWLQDSSGPILEQSSVSVRSKHRSTRESPWPWRLKVTARSWRSFVLRPLSWLRAVRSPSRWRTLRHRPDIPSAASVGERLCLVYSGHRPTLRRWPQSAALLRPAWWITCNFLDHLFVPLLLHARTISFKMCSREGVYIIFRPHRKLVNPREWIPIFLLILKAQTAVCYFQQSFLNRTPPRWFILRKHRSEEITCILRNGPQ